jgi:hypothetical protein
VTGTAPRWGGALTALATAILAAACGSGGSTTAARARSTTTVTHTASVTVSTSTASASRARPRARTASAPPGCTPAHTVVSIGQQGAATGHVGIPLLFHNSGTAPCTLTGYPGAALVHGRRHLDVARTPQGFIGGLSPRARANPLVRLAPGGVASAILEGEDFNPQTSAACPRYSGLLITPPNQTVTVRVTLSLTICDPQIHPVVAGTSGRQRS